MYGSFEDGFCPDNSFLCSQESTEEAPLYPRVLCLWKPSVLPMPRVMFMGMVLVSRDSAKKLD